jgi:ribosomal protein S27E
MSLQQELSQCPVCGATSAYELSGIVGKYAKCSQCETKWKLIMENQKIVGLAMHELPKNGEGLFKVASTNAPLFIEIGKPIALSFWKDLKLDGKIDWAFLSSAVDPTVLKCIIIDKSESVLNLWTGNRLVKNDKVTVGPASTRMLIQFGALLLTSRRLIWLEKRRMGVWKPQFTYQVALDMPLEEIKGISAESGDSGNWEATKKVSIVANDGEKTFNLQNSLQELLKPMIECAIKMRKDENEAERKRDKIHVMLDFSFLKSIMEKGGLVMQVLKCPECGATVDFPKSGNETKCNHCGKTIYAQDVFEKVKGLI